MEHESSAFLLLQESSADIGVPLSTEQVERFMVYLDQLQLWNQSINLTSITRDDEIIIKHFVDSIAALRAHNIAVGAGLLDVGTGAGFPGIPLKIVRHDLNITLLEPVKKKVSFLRLIIGLLRLGNVEIFEGSLDEFMRECLPYSSFDYVTTRAVKPDLVLRDGTRLLRQGGKVILYSSQGIMPEDLSPEWLVRNEYSFKLPKGYGRRVISVLTPTA